MEKIHSALKKKYPDAVILIKSDDYFITFNEDADLLKKVFGYNKSFNAENFDNVLCVLVKIGYKVAVCMPPEQ